MYPVRAPPHIRLTEYHGVFSCIVYLASAVVRASDEFVPRLVESAVGQREDVRPQDLHRNRRTFDVTAYISWLMCLTVLYTRVTAAVHVTATIIVRVLCG